MAKLCVRDRETTADLIDEVDTEDMYDIFPNRITSISWQNIVKTADMPLRFASTVDVEIIVAYGICPVPFGF